MEGLLKKMNIEHRTSNIELKKSFTNKTMSVDGDKQIGKTYERKIPAGK